SFDIALAGSDHAEGDTGFREAHRCPFGAEVSAGAYDLVGEVSGHLVFCEHPVAVHGVEVELGRIDHEMVVQGSPGRAGSPVGAVRGRGRSRFGGVPDPCPRLASWAASCTATGWCGAISVPCWAA